MPITTPEGDTTARLAKYSPSQAVVPLPEMISWDSLMGRELKFTLDQFQKWETEENWGTVVNGWKESFILIENETAQSPITKPCPQVQRIECKTYWAGGRCGEA